MLMDCPRCGFNQPKDRYCASCGLDVDAFNAKPKPILVRILQNPDFHLSLLAIFIVFVVAYMIYLRSSWVSRQVHEMLGTPIASRDAGDPNEQQPEAAPPPQEALPVAAEMEEVQPQVAAPATAAAEVAPPPKDAKRMEAVFWELAHETLTGLISAGEKVGESNAGRVYLFKDGAKIAEAISKGGRRVSQARTVDLANNAQIMVTTPPAAPEPFQFGLSLQVTKWENREASLRWDTQLVLSQPESPAELASQTPAIKAVVESTLNGTASFNANGMVMIVIEPNNRTPRPEFMNKAGEGPWRIFASEDFRAGITDWVVLIQLK